MAISVYYTDSNAPSLQHASVNYRQIVPRRFICTIASRGPTLAPSRFVSWFHFSSPPPPTNPSVKNVSLYTTCPCNYSSACVPYYPRWGLLRRLTLTILNVSNNKNEGECGRAIFSKQVSVCGKTGPASQVPGNTIELCRLSTLSTYLGNP